MKIGIFGTGVVGQTIAEKLVQLGHQVMIGTRDKQTALLKTGKDNFGRPAISEWLKNNSKVQLETFSDAAKFGELLVNATNGFGTLPALEAAGESNLSNKIMIDISNPLDFSKGMPPSLFVNNTDSLAEQIQRQYPDTKVVKSLNTVTASVMVNPSLLSEPTNIFLNGNDADAKLKVKNLLTTFGWKAEDIIDMGDITTARGTEQYLPLWVRLWGTLQTSAFNIKIVRGKK